MTRWEILEKTREVLEGKCIPYETYKQIRASVASLVGLEDPISKKKAKNKTKTKPENKDKKKEETSKK